MNKLIYATFWISILFISCEKPVKRVPKVYEKEPIKRFYGGEVKSIKEYDCKPYKRNGEIVFDKYDCILLNHRKFDKNEITVHERKWRYDGTLAAEIIKKTDSEGRMVEEIVNGKIRRTYSYNKKGFIEEEVHWFSDGDLDVKREYFYDEYNCVIRIEATNQFGKYRSEYKYDNLNREIESLDYDELGQLKEKTIRKYKKDSDDFEYKEYDRYGYLTYDSEIKNEKNSESEIEFYSNGEIKKVKDKSGSISEYNDRGQLLEFVWNDNGVWFKTTRNKYREDGVLIEEEEIGSNPYRRVITRYKKIDNFKNWQERHVINVDIDSEDSGWVSVYYREIEYWD